MRFGTLPGVHLIFEKLGARHLVHTNNFQNVHLSLRHPSHVAYPFGHSLWAVGCILDRESYRPGVGRVPVHHWIGRSPAENLELSGGPLDNVIPRLRGTCSSAHGHNDPIALVVTTRPGCKGNRTGTVQIPREGLQYVAEAHHDGNDGTSMSK